MDGRGTCLRAKPSWPGATCSRSTSRTISRPPTRPCRQISSALEFQVTDPTVPHHIPLQCTPWTQTCSVLPADGDSVILIPDRIVDLGPEGAAANRVFAIGTPEAMRLALTAFGMLGRGARGRRGDETARETANRARARVTEWPRAAHCRGN